MTTANYSLVKYDNPIQISTQGKKVKKESKNILTPTEDILNSILPPREWTENGQLWVQYVSSAPSTKKDVLLLQKSLDTQLQQKQARETGLCSIREELYSQGFDEIIRQVTIMCAERGLLLLRVREELRMEISAYQTLYESSIAYGIRSALSNKQCRKEMEMSVAELEKECYLLEKKIKEQHANCDRMRKKASEERVTMNAKHAEDVELIKNHNAKLRQALSEKLSVNEDKKKEKRKEAKLAEQKKKSEVDEKIL